MKDGHALFVELVKEEQEAFASAVAITVKWPVLSGHAPKDAAFARFSVMGPDGAERELATAQSIRFSVRDGVDVKWADTREIIPVEVGQERWPPTADNTTTVRAVSHGMVILEGGGYAAFAERESEVERWVVYDRKAIEEVSW